MSDILIGKREQVQRLFRNLELIVGGLFFVSILPPFWTYAIGGTNLRYILWLLWFFVRRGGNL